MSLFVFTIDIRFATNVMDAALKEQATTSTTIVNPSLDTEIDTEIEEETTPIEAENTGRFCKIREFTIHMYYIYIY